jgi:GNAT superfamily N-acetyltransferase
MTITIRPANKMDESLSADLIALSMGGMGDALFGLGEHARQLRFLGRMYQGIDSRFSHRLVELAEVDGQPSGLLLTIPGSDLTHLDAGVIRYLLPCYGLAGTLRFLVKAARLAPYSHEADRTDYLVSNLAVRPACWGQGIGQKLLERAEQLALAAGYLRCSLDVDIDNERARSLYLKVGYHIIETHSAPHLYRLLGTNGFQRLVKNLAN